MSLIAMPKELEGIKLILKEKDPVTGEGEWVLPDNATPEQKKALREYRELCRQAKLDMCGIEKE
jgi:hypothetical protein